MNIQMWQSVGIRFVKAFLAGAAGSITVTSVQNSASWSDLKTALINLALAGTIGGIAGILLAFEKWATWTE